MQITYTFDSATWGTAPSGYETQAQAAFGYVVNLYNALFTSNVAVGISDVYWKPVTGGSASNPTLPGLFVNYSTLLGDLQAHEDTAVQKTAFGSLPTTDPTSSYPNKYFSINPYEAEALGIADVSKTYLQQYGTAIPASSVTFNPNEPWSFPPNVQPGPTQDYFVNAAEHELSEVMGRHAYVGRLVTSNNLYASANGTNLYSPMDLFRYTHTGQMTRPAAPAPRTTSRILAMTTVKSSPMGSSTTRSMAKILAIGRRAAATRSRTTLSAPVPIK